MVEALLDATRRLGGAMDTLRFGAPVSHTYNPLTYAWAPHADYLRRYGEGRGRVVFLGMNPGPFGMAQTGVPFGEVRLVRDWLGICGTVGRPPREHPKRPILGFALERREISGQRLWGWAKDRFVTPEAFFAQFFVVNYCPLLFLAATGRNLTPDKVAAAERRPLLSACDHALCEIVDILAPSRVIGVGAWAQGRARAALPATTSIGRILHPSPASPAANRGWRDQMEAQLVAQDVLLP